MHRALSELAYFLASPALTHSLLLLEHPCRLRGRPDQKRSSRENRSASTASGGFVLFPFAATIASIPRAPLISIAKRFR